MFLISYYLYQEQARKWKEMAKFTNVAAIQLGPTWIIILIIEDHVEKMGNQEFTRTMLRLMLYW